MLSVSTKLEFEVNEHERHQMKRNLDNLSPRAYMNLRLWASKKQWVHALVLEIAMLYMGYLYYVSKKKKLCEATCGESALELRLGQCMHCVKNIKSIK